MYMALTLTYLGFAVLSQSAWALLLLPVVLIVMTRRVIRREELYLERRFGAEYIRYKAQVRRWI
jgi:protein-S-isoprenylcysteine O-methyltransferase Ste14